MPETSPVPDWVTVGPQVVLYRPYATYPYRKVRRVKVKRFTPTRVVLDNEDWVPRNTLQRRDGGVWGTDVELRQPSDPEVVQAETKHQADDCRRHTAQDLRMLLAKWDRTRDDKLVDLMIQKLTEAKVRLDDAKARLQAVES